MMIPMDPISFSTDFEKAFTAALAAAYGACPGFPFKPEMEVMLTILPFFFLINTGRISRTVFTTDFRFSSMISQKYSLLQNKNGAVFPCRSEERRVGKER